MNIEYYRTKNGRIPYLDWLKKLKNPKARAAISAAVERIQESGHLGDHKPLKGEPLIYEKRLMGVGYRLYYGLEEGQIIIFLLGSDKDSQRDAIRKAREYWEEYLSR